MIVDIQNTVKKLCEIIEPFPIYKTVFPIYNTPYY